jgi:hypothetical protein
MKEIVKCVNVSRARKCPAALKVLHGPQMYCTDYKKTGTNGTIVRQCEQVPVVTRH